MCYTKTVIVSSYAQLPAYKVGQWVWFTANSNIADNLRMKRGQYMGFDQFNEPVINLAPMPQTPKHKNNNWKAQFKSNKGLRMFTIERQGF